jgi:hypothetical protein
MGEGGARGAGEDGGFGAGEGRVLGVSDEVDALVDADELPRVAPIGDRRWRQAQGTELAARHQTPRGCHFFDFAV